jgi:hypothetical protein
MTRDAPLAYEAILIILRSCSQLPRNALGPSEPKSAMKPPVDKTAAAARATAGPRPPFRPAVVSTPPTPTRSCSAHTTCCRASAVPGNATTTPSGESFFATLKEELVYRTTWSTRERAWLAIFECIEVFYNHEYRHSVLGNVSPEEFEACHRTGHAAWSDCPPKRVKPNQIL